MEQTQTSLMPTLEDVVNNWIAEVREVNGLMLKALQDSRIQAALPPRTREVLRQLLVRVRHCQMAAPTTAMIRAWGREQPSWSDAQGE